MSIMKHGLWKNVEIASGYVEDDRRFEDNILHVMKEMYKEEGDIS